MPAKKAVTLPGAAIANSRDTNGVAGAPGSLALRYGSLPSGSRTRTEGSLSTGDEPNGSSRVPGPFFEAWTAVSPARSESAYFATRKGVRKWFVSGSYCGIAHGHALDTTIRIGADLRKVPDNFARPRDGRGPVLVSHVGRDSRECSKMKA
jgi:hypothetical protein